MGAEYCEMPPWLEKQGRCQNIIMSAGLCRSEVNISAYNRDFASILVSVCRQATG